MIKDRIENSDVYCGISDNLKNGFEWLKSIDFENLPDGKYEINGSDVYANVQTYITKDDALYEAHREYIDIQYMINGAERIGVTNYSNCSVAVEYDSNNDIEFLTGSFDCEYQILNAGEFIVLFPQDAHKPSIKIDSNIKVKKVVVKVKLTK